MTLRVEKESVVVADNVVGQQSRNSTFLDELDLCPVQHPEVVDAYDRRRRRIAMRAGGDN
jgi:hypothetical protein